MLKSLKLVRNLGRASQKRTFLSPAYYCNEVWENRLTSPLLQNVNLDVLYHDLEQRFQRTRQISPVDVDIFVNCVRDDVFIGELMDLVHKLRLTAQTGNTLPSTPHAVIRTLLQNSKDEDLLLAIDDRLNYGLFLDDFTANILLDTFWKRKNFTAGALIGSQMMLQEDFSHPISTSYALLHCYNYLLNPTDWPRPPPPNEPENEVKVRVKYLRNPYEDDHFDLKDPQRIVGKTLLMATKGQTDALNSSLNILGRALFSSEKCTGTIYKEIYDLIPEDLREGLKSEEGDVQGSLQANVKRAVEAQAEKDMKSQSETFYEWERQRVVALEEQRRRIQTAQRLAQIEEMQEELKRKEQKLTFFEKEEVIELEIEAKDKMKAEVEKERLKVHKKSATSADEYIPPEVTAKQTN